MALAPKPKRRKSRRAPAAGNGTRRGRPPKAAKRKRARPLRGQRTARKRAGRRGVPARGTYRKGFDDAYDIGYNAGYAQGLEEGKNLEI
ncbi:MAG: hypothetical protein C6P35_12345 [Cohnella sp.]|jgi:flagellar biosynthesis/type III secretory pathway protein FliH|nr:MAG: hypothetical protein C6P35_12345 [Cohnella sp.]